MSSVFACPQFRTILPRSTSRRHQDISNRALLLSQHIFPALENPAHGIDLSDNLGMFWLLMRTHVGMVNETCNSISLVKKAETEVLHKLIGHVMNRVKAGNSAFCCPYVNDQLANQTTGGRTRVKSSDSFDSWYIEVAIRTKLT